MLTIDFSSYLNYNYFVQINTSRIEVVLCKKLCVKAVNISDSIILNQKENMFLQIAVIVYLNG